MCRRARRNVRPGERRRRRVEQAQTDTEARRRRARHDDVEHGRAARERGRDRPQVQGEAAQGAVRDVHRDDAAAREQEGQHVAEVQLVVDGRDQQRDQRGGEEQARPGGQDVDVALVEQQRVAAAQALLPPGSEAAPHQGHGAHAGDVHGKATASTIARTCSTRPRPAPATGTRRCAAAWTRTDWMSSGAT